jgi:hypothetical protein
MRRCRWHAGLAARAAIGTGGRRIALLLVEDLLLSYSSKFRAILEKAHHQLEQGEGIPEDEFWREIDKT